MGDYNTIILQIQVIIVELVLYLEVIQKAFREI